MHNPEQLTQLVSAMIASGDHKINSVQDYDVYAFELVDKAREIAYEINKFYCACGDIIAPDHVEYADTVANGCCSGCEAGGDATYPKSYFAMDSNGNTYLTSVRQTFTTRQTWKGLKEFIAKKDQVSVEDVGLVEFKRVD